ncbi:glycosyltransferase [Microbacterium trichothecenolyticum]
MASIIIASVPIHGHVVPLLSLARGLVERGDDVRFLTGTRFRDAVSATGATHVALPADADFDDRDLLKTFPELARLSPVRGVGFYVEHVFTRPGVGQYRAIQDLLRADPSAAVVVDPTLAAGAVMTLLPARERPAIVVAGIIPLNLPSRDVPPFGFGLTPRAGWPGRARNAVLTWFEERVILRGARRAGDEVRRATVGATRAGSGLGWVGRADAVAQCTVASFEYPRPDASTVVRFTGPIAESSVDHHPVPAWWPEVSEHRRPIVHVTQGTLANNEMDDLIRPAVRALADEDVLVVVATGGAPADALGEMPSNVRVADFLPYDVLLPRTSVFLTNGGYGGTQFALRHGVPIVVAPGGEDKSEVAARVQWSGVGISLRTRRPSPTRIRDAVREVIGEASYRLRAVEMAAEIAASPGTAGVIDTIDDAVARHSRIAS